MVRDGEKRESSGSGPKGKLEDDIDALFMLPLAEFTSGRNTLAAQLKKAGRTNEAERVKLLAKPSVSAWAVNQLYWNHRDAFDDLIATGKRFRPAHTSRFAGRVAGMRDSLDARRDALTHLSDLATELLRDAGHNPSQDTLRRIVTTLEAISAYALLPDGPAPGRLTHDVDPPSFESLASLMSTAGAPDHDDEPAPSRKAATPVANTRQKTATNGAVRKLEEFRQAKITAAKVALQDAKRSLSDARARAQNLETAQKKANAEVKTAEKYRRDAEERLKKATAAYDDVVERAQTVDAEAEEAADALEDAKRALEQATRELDSLLR